MITDENFQMLKKHVNNALRLTIKAHPEFGINPQCIESVSKRLTSSIAGDYLDQYRQKMYENSHDVLMNELIQENSRLKLKVTMQAKSIIHFKNQLSFYKNNIR